MADAKLSRPQMEVYTFLKDCDGYRRSLPKGRPLDADDLKMIAHNVVVAGRFHPELMKPLEEVVSEMKERERQSVPSVEAVPSGPTRPVLPKIPDEERAIIGILEAVGG